MANEQVIAGSASAKAEHPAVPALRAARMMVHAALVLIDRCHECQGILGTYDEALEALTVAQLHVRRARLVATASARSDVH